MKHETRTIKKLYDEIYEKINKKYPIQKPKLRVVHYDAGSMGSCNYAKQKITINSNYAKEFSSTIIHELCHWINHTRFNPKQKRKIPHNKQFWLLCYEFGLTEKDYSYGLTTTMKTAKKEIITHSSGDKMSDC